MTAAIVAVIAIAVLLVIFLFAAIKVAREYERGIIFRLGRLLPEPKARASSCSSRSSTAWSRSTCGRSR